MPFHKKNSLKALFVLALYCFVANTAHSQNIDTLLKRASTTFDNDPEKGILLARQAYNYAYAHQQTSARLKCLNMLGVLYWEKRNNTTASKYITQGLLLAKQHGVDSLTGNILVTKGLIQYSNNDYEKAINTYQQAITYFGTNGLIKKIGIAFMNIGICQRKLSRFEQANSNYFKAIGIFEKLKDSVNVCGLYNSIGNCYASLKNYQNAVIYHRKALALSTRLNDRQTIEQSLNNLGYAFKEQQKPDSAIYYLNKCYALRKTEPDSGKLVLTLQNLGSAWKQKGYFEKAFGYFTRSVDIAKAYNMQDEQLRGNLDLAELYLQKKNYAEVNKILNAAELLARQIKSFELFEQILALKVQLFEETGKYRDAFINEKHKNRLHDSLFNIAQARAISEMETKYQSSQKDKDIAALHVQGVLERKLVTQQRSYIVAMAVGIVLVLTLLLLSYRSYVQKKKDNLHIQSLMGELHHRVKNNLQILSGLLKLQLSEISDESHKNTLRENELRLNSMNLIHKRLYGNNKTTKVDIQSYLEQLAGDISISFNAKSKNIKTHVSADAIMVPAEKATLIGLIVNELVTNAYKYAFKNEGNIYVKFEGAGPGLFLLTIGDDGDGPATKQANDSSNSFGLRMVNMMSKQLKAKVTIENNPGLVYKLIIPNLQEA